MEGGDSLKGEPGLKVALPQTMGGGLFRLLFLLSGFVASPPSPVLTTHAAFLFPPYTPSARIASLAWTHRSAHEPRRGW
jgi:hypothetical protein